jgi:hypothetical protein
MYAQPALQVPAKTTSVLLTTKQPTFKWSQVSGATQYELYITSSTTDTTKANQALIPAAANVNKSKRYVSVGSASTDTTFALTDTVLVRNTEYYWKVRAKVSGTWSAWAYPYSYFKIGAPSYMMSNANALIKFNHDTLGAITNVTFLQGSNKLVLDTAYNRTNQLGIGGNGAQKDTIVSWYTSANTDTNIFTYQNAAKYGPTGSKVMTVYAGTNGVTADIALTLETGKTVNIATAWKPGGALTTGGVDNVLLVNNLGVATKTSLTYPATAAPFGASSIILSAMYDNRYSEYFGFKSSSPIAVVDTQKSTMLKQVLTFSNSTGSNATYSFSFAMRQTRADYFDTWANDRPMIISKPAAGDSLISTSKYVDWESFGARPASISFSSDGGTTFGSDTTLTIDTTRIDSAHYTMPNGPKRSNCVVKVTSSKGDAAQSGVFILDAPYAAITSPTTGDSLTIGQHEVTWANDIGATFTDVWCSLDSGKTWSGDSVLNPASTGTSGNMEYYFNGAKNVANYAALKLCGPVDTVISSFFKVEKRYATITTPKTGANLSIGKSYVVWTNLTGSGVATVDCSLDSGKTWAGAVPISPASTAIKDSILYDFYGGKSSSNYNTVRIRTTAGADTAQSGFFTLGKGGAAFSIPTACGNPAAEVVVSIRAKDYVSGDSINSFDLNMTFDSTYAHFDSLNYAPLLQGSNWIVVMDSSNTKTTTSNYVRLAAVRNAGGQGIKDSAFVKLFFNIKDKQSSIGQIDNLVIKNSTLAASGNGASPLDVSGSTNGLLKVYSSISGNLRYLHEDTVTTSHNISGDSLMVYRDVTDTTNNAWFDVANGQFDMTNRPPNDNVIFNPSARVYTPAGWSAIDVVDVRLALMDFIDPLSTRAKIAADVNGDSVVNSTDAMMIMNISVDSTYLKGLGLSNWVFVDSTILDSVEHSSDSLSAWWTAEQHSISYTLTNQQTNQDFYGVLRGDVDFSYGASQDVNTMKTLKNPGKNPGKETTSSSSILFSTNADMNVRPGDTVWIPLNIDPADTVIGGFNASVQVDPKTFSYSGQFKKGQSMPQNGNWYIAAKCDANGSLKVAATDFSAVINPIVNNGTALLFEFVVNKNAKIGTTSPVDVQTQTVVDTKMRRMASLTKNGQAEISSEGSSVATNYELSQNYPNPFNPSTTIQFAVPMDSKVDIVIYNVLGQKVATLVSGTVPAGYHDVVWNASNFSSGVYFSVMKCTSTSTGENFKSVKKLMLVK